jgi:hypothetical protein
MRKAIFMGGTHSRFGSPAAGTLRGGGRQKKDDPSAMKDLLYRKSWKKINPL